VTVAGPKAALVAAILQPGSAAKLADAGRITLNGDRGQLETYAAVRSRLEWTVPLSGRCCGQVSARFAWAVRAAVTAASTSR
jgi:hypothetical protein